MDTSPSDSQNKKRALSIGWLLKIIGVIMWVIALAWVILSPGFEPLLAFLGGVVAIFSSFIVDDKSIAEVISREPSPETLKKNRARMLKNVHRYWVEGVLEHSLHGAALMALGMESKPDAVEQPLDWVLHGTWQADRDIPPETPITDIFVEVSKRLLILGEPGSGKTTMLLELTRDLIAAAEKNDKLPIPVVFNLSSWATEEKPLAEWLIDELSTRYQAPRKIGEVWIENNDVLLLLDGLDEVAKDKCDACVDEINAFLWERGIGLDVVICCRSLEHKALTTKLKLEGAIVLLPLTDVQIDGYLAGSGEELEAVRSTLQHDEKLREIARTPLMLNIMALTYRGMSVGELGKLTSIAAWRRHLFDIYVERMFKYREIECCYTPDKTLHYLTWLAKQMVKHKQTVFYIERMHPDWLSKRQDWRYRWGVRLVLWLVSGLAGGLVFGPTVGLTLVLILGLSENKIIKTLGGVFKRKIFLALGLVRSLALVLTRGLAFVLAIGLVLVLVVGLACRMVLGLACRLALVLTRRGADGSDTEVEMPTEPNQGPQPSLQKFIRIVLAGGLVLVLVVGLALALVIGLICRLARELFGGGEAVVKHFTLRFVLWRSGDLPRNYAHFLDYAAELILLRKVGGGYIFVHHLLLEHFAANE